MSNSLKIKKHALIKGLSLAIDLAEKKKMSHAQQITSYSMIVSKHLELSEKEKELLYYSSLLHDIGATSAYLPLEHCLEGHRILSTLPLDEEISTIIKYHHETIDGLGPNGISGQSVPILSQIIHLGNLLEISLTENNALISSIDIYSKNFQPFIIEAFRKSIPEILKLYNKETIDTSSYLESLYRPKTEYCNLDEIGLFATAFASVIDMRSPFTAAHSKGLTTVAIDLSQRLDFTQEEKNEIWISSLLHDLGKLGIDPKIINKPGKLTVDERNHMEQHAYYTDYILSRIEGFDKIAKLASHHHEKLDGSGYPNQLKAIDLSIPERLIGVADIYQALREERPYRKALSNDEIWPIMDGMVSENKIDSDILNILKKIYGEK